MKRRANREGPGPTIDIGEAAGRRWDVVVAGAGPAGAVAARELARRDASVLLVDRASFPRGKVCGCCLNGAALATLSSVGLDDLVGRSGARRLARLHLAVGPASAELRLPSGVALSREVFDSALIREAIRAGAEFLPETESVLLPGKDAGCKVRVRRGGTESLVLGRLAIAADGLGGTFLRMIEGMQPKVRPGSRIGAGAIFDDGPSFFEHGTVYMACGRDAYVGAVRLEDGRLDVAAALCREKLRHSVGLGSLLRAALEECGFPPPAGCDRADWRGTPPLTRMRNRVAGHRLFVVGDSAAYVEPFTGEGMSWAIQAAVLLAAHLHADLRRWSPRLSAGWERKYRRFFRARGRVCLSVRALLRYRPVARAAVELLGRAPWLAQPGVKRVSTRDGRIRSTAGRRAAS